MAAPVRAQRRPPEQRYADRCSWPGCDKQHFVKALCQMHYTRQRRGADMEKPAKAERRVGKRVARDGYVSVYRPDSPSARADGWAAEHRVVMEGLLGRALLPGENVHHKNGVRDDNRAGNLELWVRTQPSGQRAKDLLAWAETIVATYAPSRSVIE